MPTAVTDLSVASWVAIAAAALFVLKIARLVRSGAWSFRVAVGLAAVFAIALGVELLPDLWAGLRKLVRAVRGLEFVRPVWLVLLVCVPPIFLVSRRSLSGLGPVRKWVAVGTRATIVTLLVLALAEPRVRRSSEHTTVLFVIDRSLSVPPDP